MSKIIKQLPSGVVVSYDAETDQWLQWSSPPIKLKDLEEKDIVAAAVLAIPNNPSTIVRIET